MSATSPRPSPPFINGGEGEEPVARPGTGWRVTVVQDGVAATRCRAAAGFSEGRQPVVGTCTKIGGNWPDVAGGDAIIVKRSASYGEQGVMGKFNLLMTKLPHH